MINVMKHKMRKISTKQNANGGSNLNQKMEMEEGVEFSIIP